MHLAEGELMLFVRARFIYVLLNTLCILVVLATTIRPAHGAEGAPVFSHGAGPYEVIIFSDYFCQPCQKVEEELGEAISDIIRRGGVRVTFVDMPLFKLTPLYARYFLYALNASATYRDALKARKLLFDKASRLGAITEEHLARDFRLEGLTIKPYDTRPSLARYSEMIRKYQISATPTFVFIYSPDDIRKYSGIEQIRKGMAELAQALEKL
jgi:protein-disulfide isomerase